MRFWGVRGSVSCPGPGTVKYGGNTPCVEVRCGEHVLVFDAGTGIRELGESLCALGIDDLDMFLSHTHYDHVVGLPFFQYAFSAGNTLRLWAGHLQPDSTIEAALRTFMAAPFFPVPVDIFHATLDYRDFSAGETLTPHPGVTLRTAPLNHPNGATGYRIDYGGHTICYVTDTAHVVGQPDDTVLGLIENADIVIYDSMFTDDEFSACADWGHSTWQECLRLCRAAGVTTPVMFHHLPGRDDGALDAIAAEADRLFPGALVAREGQTLTP